MVYRFMLSRVDLVGLGVDQACRDVRHHMLERAPPLQLDGRPDLGNPHPLSLAAHRNPRRAPRGDDREIRFAEDSLLEGAGFEPSVPLSVLTVSGPSLDSRKIAKPGDVVCVKVLEVDPKRRRIALTMRLDEAPEARPTTARAAIRPQGSEKPLRP